MTSDTITMQRSVPVFVRNLVRALLRVTSAALIAFAALALLNFPYHYDRPLTQKEGDIARKYYENAYRREPAKAQSKQESDYQTRYEAVAEQVSESLGMEKQVAAFAAEYSLQDKSVLDVGSGRGHLQDIVDNYTGLDISPSIAPLYHKKFVLGSATAMPFADDSFDSVWSVFVLEHIPNPEHALAEIRRVVRDGGILYLHAGWNDGSWLADGYAVRPYSDFGVGGKLTKASVPIRSSPGYSIMTVIPQRVVRRAAAMFGPTTLRYRRLEANYDTYWQPDSDAVNSLDSYEALIWFLSRGDDCLNCKGSDLLFPLFDSALIIRVNK